MTGLKGNNSGHNLALYRVHNDRVVWSNYETTTTFQENENINASLPYRSALRHDMLVEYYEKAND